MEGEFHVSRTLALAGISTSELRESFELCEHELRTGHSLLATAADLLPAQTRPYVHAVGAFAVCTDALADESLEADRAHAMAQWRAESLRELRLGRSEHALRRALVHTVRMWELDVAVIEELLEAFARDSAAPPEFATVADQRRYLRGVSGTVAQLCSPMLDPIGGHIPVARLMSLLGEAFQLVDILQDFPVDLARGRCYLPAQDLQRLGLSRHDLGLRRNRDALDELVDNQVSRARALVDQARPVITLVHPGSEPFLRASLLGLDACLDQAARLKSIVFTDGFRVPAPPSLSTLRSAATLRTTSASTSWLARLLRRSSGGRRASSPTVPRVLPNHIAVIMDGNRRWATARGAPMAAGHLGGKEAILRFIDSALELGIPDISVFAFSTENWSRSDSEVGELMGLFVEAVDQHVGRFHAQGVRLRWCGRRDRVPDRIRAAFEATERLTAGNTTLTCTLCMDYGGRVEMVSAARSLAADVETGLLRAAEISEEDLVRQFYLPDLPDVDLLIRTSGEQRISNFLPWHIAYAELVFTPVLWPDFTHDHLLEAIREYSRRQRRFGGNDIEAVTR